jgi:mRNA-degrading endonuclease toxin of MazEF toxin-antitoxin module
VDSLFSYSRRIAKEKKNVSTDVKIAQVKDLRQLRLLLAQDENGLKKYVYPRLRLGDVWWIPDDVSGFGDGQRHPWVIVRGYSPRRANILACPRTTTIRSPQRGIVTPAGILPDLDQDGFILLMLRRSFVAKGFRRFDYIGRLPEGWLQKIRSFYEALVKSKATR